MGIFAFRSVPIFAFSPPRPTALGGIPFAAASVTQEATGDPLRALTFHLAGQRCALPLADVREVQRAVEITRLPKAPAAVEGVIDLRGTLVAVMDPRARLRLPPKPLAPSDHLIIASLHELTVALRVDRADTLLEVDPRAVERTENLAPADELVSGVAKLPDGLVLIYDLHRFLTGSEESALRRALQDAERTGG